MISAALSLPWCVTFCDLQLEGGLHAALFLRESLKVIIFKTKSLIAFLSDFFFSGVFRVCFLPPPHFIVLLNFGLHSQLPSCYQLSLNQCKFFSWFLIQRLQSRRSKIIQSSMIFIFFFSCCSSLAKFWWWKLHQYSLLKSTSKNNLWTGHSSFWW